jgi:homoserine dehydrogenase
MAVATHRLILCGFGRVGRTFARLLVDRAPLLREVYGLVLPVVAVAELDGSAVLDPETAAGGAGPPPPLPESEGLPLLELAAHFEAKRPLGVFPDAGRPGWRGADVLERIAADALVETTPTDITDGEPGLTHIRMALGRGMHVASATKGPFLRHFAELRGLAARRGVVLKVGAAAAAALPTIDVGQVALAGTRITAFEGILNGTTNFILTRMTADAWTYADALAEAQRLGIAEPDPTLDVEGHDTANKIVVIANAVLGADLSRDAVRVQGISGVTPDDIARAKANGATLKLIGRAAWEGGRLVASVAPAALPREHPLAGVHGSEKAITYFTDTMDKITVMGGKSDPRGAAAALLKDIINIFRGGR